MMMLERTTGCGLVTDNYVNKKIFLAGWVHRRRDHGGLIFVDLRDRTGLMQLVFNPEFSQMVHEQAHKLRSEYVIAVYGTVIERAFETINKEIATGKWELHVERLDILNTSKIQFIQTSLLTAVEKLFKVKKFEFWVVLLVVF